MSGLYAPTPTLRVGADIARVFWKGAGEQRRNQFDASGWAQLDVMRRTVASFGLFSQGRNPLSEESANAFEYSGRAIYLTAGGAVALDRFRLDAVLADSHLLSADRQRQTILKVGASVQL